MGLSNNNKRSDVDLNWPIYAQMGTLRNLFRTFSKIFRLAYHFNNLIFWNYSHQFSHSHQCIVSIYYFFPFTFQFFTQFFISFSFLFLFFLIFVFRWSVFHFLICSDFFYKTNTCHYQTVHVSSVDFPQVLGEVNFVGHHDHGYFDAAFFPAKKLLALVFYAENFLANLLHLLEGCFVVDAENDDEGVWFLDGDSTHRGKLVIAGSVEDLQHQILTGYLVLGPVYFVDGLYVPIRKSKRNPV